MKPFKHESAQSIGEAARLLGKYEGKAKVNAGGTDLLGAMKDRIAEYPEVVIDIKTIGGLDYIKKDRGGLKIGALAKLADVAESPTVREEYKLLAEAAYSVASPHIRNMATVGGNLAQEVRCWYYRYPKQIGGPIVCLRKGGKVCSALPGDNRYHSLFGAAPLETYPCQSNCPAGTNIPEYLDKVKNGDYAEAARILMEQNPLAPVTGRVCPVFCEPNCNRAGLDEPVAIQCLERGVGDYILDNTSVYFAPPKTSIGKKVAIVGSGPAGLAAAYYLRRKGYEVTVYERMPEAGGMLRYSIPPYRLTKDVLKRLVAALSDMGITFRVGSDVGEATLSDLKKQYDAVLLAQGTWRSLKLGVAGEDTQGVHYALDYLAKINKGERIALGARVVVVGGGSVAMDAARTAKRLGAAQVEVVCLECREPGSKDSMLAQQEEILEAEEEGVKINPSLGVDSIRTKDGKVAGVETVTCLSVRESDGGFNPQYDRTCTATSLDADAVIIAIGQAAEDPAGKPDNKKVFQCGDMTSGPSTVIQAVASAKETVQAIESALSIEPARGAQPAKALHFVDSTFVDTPRTDAHLRPSATRMNTIEGEDVASFTAEEIEREARRCFNCGCLAVGPTDLGVALVALNGSIVTTKRIIGAEDFFSATATKSTVLEPNELIKEIRIPKPETGSRQRYDKFTLRKPIDFAIVSVASSLSEKDGTCNGARIVLGAVAPEPLRAREAEAAIIGHAIDEERAAEAAELAVKEALPLAMNDYKVEIVRTLIKRAILGREN